MPGRTRSRPVRRPIPAYKPISQGAPQSVIDARSSQAWRAVRHFTQMLPTFTSFARMATGNNKVTVRLGKQGAETDGTTIWIFPPIALGEERVHDRAKCDRRGPDKRQTCKACDAREVSLFYLFHEIAHIAFDSVVQPLNYLVDRVDGMIDDWHQKGACSHASILKAKSASARTYMDLAGAHNGFLPIIVNALEDARVNARMFRTRPGLKVMFEAGTQRVFEQGVELPDGTKVLWRDQKPNPAAIIGLFLLASGTPVEEDYFSEQVTQVLSDPDLVRICKKVVIANSAHQIMELSIDTFKRLNELGYCLVPRCEVQPSLNKAPQPDDEETNANKSTDDEPDDSSGSPQESGDGSPGEPEGGADDSDQADGGDTEDSDGGPDGSDGGGAGGPEDQQAPIEQEDAGSSGSPSAPDEHDGDDESDEPEDGSGDRSGVSQATDDEPGSEDPSSSDDPLRGSNDEDDSPEGEDGPRTEASTGGASRDNDGEDQDSSKLASPSGADAEGDDGDGAEEDGDDNQGIEGPGQSSTESSEEEDEGSELDDEEAGHAPDVSESIWDDPTNSEATEHQYDRDLDPGAPDYGTPEDVAGLVERFGAHREAGDDEEGEHPLNHTHFGDEDHTHESIFDEVVDREAVEQAARQAGVFDTSSRNIDTLEVLPYPQRGFKWQRSSLNPDPSAFAASESVMGHAVMQARLAFEDNQRTKEQRHLKSGRLDASVLGRRAPTGDPRLFAKKKRPAKKSYFFAIGVDVSGSTAFGDRNARIKRAVFAQADLLHRLGFGFAIYGMTGGVNSQDIYRRQYGDRDNVWILPVKEPNEPWSPPVQQRLADLRPVADNFDGHNIEFLRKVLDVRSETNRGVIYYTDGDMPAANADEEVVILNDEIATCRRKGYGLLAVGINTDSPRQYGLDTVQVDSDADIVKVVEQLGKSIAQS